MALPEPPEETVEVEEGAIPELYSVLEGTVASVRPFGAFIRVGKGDQYKDGLVHISAIAPGRVEKVSDYLDVGDKVWAKVVNIKEEEGKYGLDLRYVNQQTGQDLDPKNREGRFPKEGGKQKKVQTEDLVKDAKAVMEEVKRMKKESKLKKKFLKLENKRKKKLQKKLKKQAKAKGEKAEDDESSSSSSSTSSLSEATQARLRKEFGFPEPAGLKKVKQVQENGKGPGITLKERKDVSTPEGPSKGSVDRPRATADDLRGLERFRSSRSPGTRHRRNRREPPARRDSRGRHRDSRSARRSPQGAPRNERARRDSRRPPPPRERSDSRRSQPDYAQRSPSREPRRKRSQAKVKERSQTEKRLGSRERRRLYASGVADEAEDPKNDAKVSKKTKTVEKQKDQKDQKGKESTKEKSKRSKEDRCSEEEPPKKAKRKKKDTD